MLTGENGILTQAQRAKEETEEAIIDEEEALNTYEDKLNKWINGEGNTPLSEIKGKYFEEDTRLTIDGNEVLIPGGATVSGIDDECLSINGGEESKDGGLVIYITKGAEVDWNQDENANGIKDVQETYDQFVWIPVEKAYVTIDEIGKDSIDDLETYIENNKVYPMAVKISENEYKGVLYNFDDSTGTLTITPYDYNTTSSYREPYVVTGSGGSGYDATNYSNAGYGSLEEMKTGLKNEFKTMVTKVATNGGFWVGRYETTNLSTDNVTVIKGITVGINKVTWYNMYKNQKNYSSTEFSDSTPMITSSMIWGNQWDQIMIWMKGVQNITNDTNGNHYIINSVGMGNFGVDENGEEKTSQEVANTGSSENFKVKNIYDLAGNIYDWTLEANSNNNRIIRRRFL